MNPNEVIRDLLSRALPDIQDSRLSNSVTVFLVTGHWEEPRKATAPIYFLEELDDMVLRAVRSYWRLVGNTPAHYTRTAVNAFFRDCCNDLELLLAR